MITGQIEIHEEPEQKKYWQGDDEYDYQGYNWYQPSQRKTKSHTSGEERQNILKLMKLDLESRGWKPGAKVGRVTGFGTSGTITEITEDPWMGYNFNLDEYNPIKVQMDGSSHSTYFSEDELILLKGENNGS